MSKLNKAINDATDNVGTNRIIHMKMYALWRSKHNDNFSIQALFAPGVKLSFKRQGAIPIGNPQDRQPYIHCLDFNLIQKADGQFFIKDGENQKEYSTQSFRLRISDPGLLGTSHFEEPYPRKIINIDDMHYFLFDVNFQKSPPGECVTFWKTLPIYSYYLINSGKVDIFEIFLRQFSEYIGINRIEFTQSHCIGFLNTTWAYFSNTEKKLSNQTATINFVRMIGLLPITNNSLSVADINARKLSRAVLRKISKQAPLNFQESNPNKWNEFINGLAILMLIELFDEENHDTEFNALSILNRISSNQLEQRQIANRLLGGLLQLQLPIPRTDWMTLMDFADEKNNDFDCITLASSFEQMISCLEYVISFHSKDEDLAQKVHTIVGKKLQNKESFTINLQIIVKLLKYLNKQPPVGTNNEENIRFVQLVLESNKELQKQIVTCLNNLTLPNDDLYLLRDLFLLYNPNLLHDVDKTMYLVKILKQNQKRTCDFYQTWFQCFLCDEHYAQTEEELEQFRRLLNEWSNKFRDNPDLLKQMAMKMNLLLEKLVAVVKPESNDRRLELFIEHMIDIYIKENQVYEAVAKLGLHVQNKMFLDAFANRFASKYINSNKNILKILTDYNNPLYRLMELHSKQSQISNDLLLHLINLCSIEIRPSDTELYEHSFLQPAPSTCTYIILFNDCFAQLSVRNETLDRLKNIWSKWEELGLTYKEISTKKWYTQHQEDCFSKIWESVRKYSGAKYQIKLLFDTADAKFTEIIQTKGNIDNCLNDYCEQATDKQLYIDLLATLQKEIESLYINQIQLSSMLSEIVLYVKELKPFARSDAWLKFYENCLQEHGNKLDEAENRPTLSASIETNNEHKESCSGSRSKNNSNIITTDDSFVSNLDLCENFDDMELTATTTIGSLSTTLDTNTKCVDIFRRATKILNVFQQHLKGICDKFDTTPIQQLFKLFPNVQTTANDIDVLKSSIQSDIAPKLIKIVEFRKHQSQIKHICNGLQKFLSSIELSLDEKSIRVICILSDLLTIDEQTLGNSCFERYEQYLINFAEIYTETILNLWSQYSCSYHVIDFLINLSSDNMDKLLEAVNDWDETFVSTKTVMDYAVLKHFFDQVYSKIKDLQKSNSTLTLKQISKCFEDVLTTEEFQNVLDLFPTCSSSLSAIQRLFLELTDKGKSKRQQIIDIMRQSSIKFEQNPEKKNEFNVLLLTHNFTFADLSELRDRARLMEYSYGTRNKTDTESQIEQLQQFIAFVNTIEIILVTLSSLFVAGHPLISVFNQKGMFTSIDSKYDELQQFCDKLKEDLNIWEKDLCLMYEKYPELTYFFCEQFHDVEEFLSDNKNDDANRGLHLLNYIGFDMEKFKQNSLTNYSISMQPIERFGSVAQVLAEHRIDPKENLLAKKIWLIKSTNDGILSGIFSLFHLAKSDANIHQVFYCTEKTNWIEIRAFIYRCFFSKTLQILVRPHLLSADIQDRFMPLLRKFIEREPTHRFYLGLITTSTEHDTQLINALKTLNIVIPLRDKDLLNNVDLNNKLQPMLEHCVLVTSHLAGLGKTTLVRKLCENLNKTSIKFFIGGNVQADDIARRLIDRIKDKENFALHIIIGPVDNIRTLDEILYCLTVFNCFRFGQTAVSLAPKTPIFIELDSSPFAVKEEKLAICRYVRAKHNIERIKWHEYQFQLPTVQCVVSYLNAIDTQEIINVDINSSSKRLIDKQTCLELMRKYFSPGRNPEFITWTQIGIFIAVYYKLFDGFSKCGHFLVNSLKDSQRQLRLDILQAFIKSSKVFTSLSVENVRKQQRASAANKENTKAQSETVVKWETTQPFTIVFSATDDPIFVYKTVRDVPQTLIDAFRTYYNISTSKIKSIKNSETTAAAVKQTASLLVETFSDASLFPDYGQLSHVQFFLKLASLSHKFFNKSICIKCYRQFPYKANQCEWCGTNVHLRRPKTFNSNDVMAFQTSIATSIETQYILTPDNYTKMLLVFLRVQSGLPVLLMGETGCGKTALITFLCRIILDDELEIVRMHAGINTEKIVEKMLLFINKAKLCQAQKKRLWVFFDEFNTTHSISIIKEITCERTFLGEKLPENMVFLGACNPRRYRPDEILFDNNIGIKKERYDVQQTESMLGGKRLLYTVVPLPETMLEYVWDYGYLDSDTEKKYIVAMLKTCPHLSADDKWFPTTVTLICKSQEFIRQKEDVSSVSLRDVARFCRLFNWMYEAVTIITKTNDDNKISDNQKIIGVLPRSVVNALLLCYYFRLKSIEHRRDYITMLEAGIFNAFPDKNKTKGFIMHWLEMEQTNIISQMELPPATAKNRAMLDNIFVLLACIVNHIPVIICGKPGCSKTSAVQIVISNLKGKKSRNAFLQTLPELIAVSYQGSRNCTSESVENVFERASKYIKAQKDTPLLPVIVFDEIGLAELSPHNPLKVLHAELEVESCQYGFVGISNWRLDASKMNRALYLACADPDVEDLKLTGTVIAKTMLNESVVTRIDKKLLPALATAYHELFLCLKTKQKYEHYFGLRDFYSLIKGIFKDIHANPNADEYKIIRQQLAINFDGIVDGSDFMWESFCESLKRNELINQYQPPNLKQLLDKDLNNRSDNRYLMLIAENESIIDYVERYIYTAAHSRAQSVRTLIGSKMPGDMITTHTYTETYSYRVLMDIILYTETSMTLIMRQLEHLYDNLYDMFNQNFAVSACKKYCRIALGALYHPRCVVHDDFHCIVFITKQDVEKCDPPFLNRFEKHPIEIKDLIDSQHWTIADKLHKWLADFLPTTVNDHFPLLQHLFIGYNPNHICSLVSDSFEELSQQDQMCNEEMVIDLCKKKLLRVASFDLVIISARKCNNTEDTKELKDLIDQYYAIHRNSMFLNVIERNIHKQIIYTYTQIYEKIAYDTNKIDEIKLGNFKTELELINKVKTYYQSDSPKRLLLIRIDYRTEYKQLLSIKHILLNALNDQIRQEERYVWLIIHLQRNMLHDATNDVLFSNWSIDMIDNLNAHSLITHDAVMDPSYISLINNQTFTLSECLFDELIERCMSKFRFEVIDKKVENRINERRNDIISNFSIENTEFSLRRIVQEKLADLIKHIPYTDASDRYLDWRKDLYSDARTTATCRSFNEAFETTVSYLYDRYFLLLIAHLELHGFIDSYEFCRRKKDEKLKQIWLSCLNSTLGTIDRNFLNVDTVEISLIFDLRLPCATDEYAILKEIRRRIQQKKQTITDLDNDLDEYYEENFFTQQIQNKSVYQNYFAQSIFIDANLFQYYQYDQLFQFITEHNIHLSVDFVFQLINTNPKLDNKSRLKYLLIDHEELLQLLHIFEKTSQLADEKTMSRICKDQFLITDNPTISKNNVYYTLVLKQDQFFQLPPGCTDVIDDYEFDCDGDPFIENSIMNMIELILSTDTITNSTVSVEALTTACGIICQRIFTLSKYSVDNLERLRSFLSLTRCIMSLTSNESLTILKKACASGLQSMFESCQSIHDFVEKLADILKNSLAKVEKDSIQQSVVKLELDLLRNWLVNHSNQYYEILKLISQKENNLWRYSAKIFSHLLQKFKLRDVIIDHHGQIPNNDEYKLFENHLQNITNETNIIERLMVDRIHMDLMLKTNENQYLERLHEGCIHFEKNMDILTSLLTKAKTQSRLQLIGLLSWIKYYMHMYSFALGKDCHSDTMNKIDRFLSNNGSLFGSTIKLFILKQLIKTNELTAAEICEAFQRRQVTWLEPLLARIKDLKNRVQDDIIMPAPLFEGREEFFRVNVVFNDIHNVNQIRKLLDECAHNQYLMYGIYLWFIHNYCRFYSSNVVANKSLVKIVSNDLQQLFSTVFQPIGYKLILSLCKNFTPNSYFHILSTMSTTELHYRLLALNITALCLSTRALQDASQLGTLLLNNQKQMPMSYFEHILCVCLLGFAINDPIVTQMLDVKTRIQERIKAKQIFPQGSFIYQCSKDCRWMFYFENCGVPNSRSKCPLCKKDIGAQAYGVLVARDPPQIQMNINEGLQTIEKYLNEFNRQLRLGYYETKPANQSDIGDKSNHLNRTVSFRFLHMFTHAQLLVLIELEYLHVNYLSKRMKIDNPRYFHEHFEKDYELLTKSCTNPNQCYIWLYKLINHMLASDLIKPGLVDNQVKVIEFEQLIEQKIMFPHITSSVDEINQYRVAYTKFIGECNPIPPFTDFIDELRLDEEKYPLLSFFNFSRINTSNPFDEFRTKIENLPFSDKLYPVTTFLLKRLEEYANIQHLYPIITFTNYLCNKYNHRIKRNRAAMITIDDCLKESGIDQEMMKTLLKQFIHAWYQLNLETVQFGCQKPKIERPVNAENFAKNTSLASFLLNTSKDSSSILVAAYIHTLSKMQNEIIGYFHSTVINETISFQSIPVQAIKPEHVFRFDAKDLSNQLIRDGFVINSEYGKGIDLIYDYTEIENALRNLVSSLQLLEYESLHLFNYQFELYAENTSVIKQIRRRIPQQSLTPNDRIKLTNQLQQMTEDEIIHFMGSLDLVFTYLSNADPTCAGDTFKVFIEKHIRRQSCLTDSAFRRTTFSDVLLTHIISLYELIEEIAFDRVLREYVKSELRDAKLADNTTFDQFVAETFHKETMPKILQSSSTWIAMLKRLLIRVLNASVELDVPLQYYLERIDLWNGDITEENLQYIEVNEAFLLQHTYIILCDLESREKPAANKELTKVVQQPMISVGEQKLQAKTWHSDISNESGQTSSNRYTIINNVFAFASLNPPADSDLHVALTENHNSWMYTRNIVYDTYQGINHSAFKSDQPNVNVSFSENLYYNTNNATLLFGIQQMYFADWQKTGQDNNSIIADPLFAGDVTQCDFFTVKPNSPAVVLGFANITKLAKWTPGCDMHDHIEDKQFYRW